MPETVGYDELVAMLEGAIEQVRANQALLSKLDSVGGDGDHGTTMARAMGNVEKAVAEGGSRELKGFLFDLGWAILGVDGGATGPLLGTLFTGMADGAGGRESLDCAAVAAMFEAGLAAVQKQTKAQVGDKTMLDALVPAVAALRAAADAGEDITSALGRAAEAAEQGAASTKAMAARFGRARNVGEQSIGHQDPGATSVSLIFRGFANALAS